uniref:Asparagine--tRNA ligase n=1 Tax=Panagrolaimus sp. JU765 TaxID=591449 RepID=A0AC34Q657_9BILA
MFLKYVSPIQKLLKSANEIESVVINGWVKKEHKKGRWSFLHISDGVSNDTIQVVVPKDVGHNLGIGSAITVSGKWLKSSGRQQSMELIANKCRVWSKDEGNLNVSSPNQIRSQLHLRSKHPSYAALLRIRSTLTSLAHRFFNERGYLHVDTPLISSNDCEGAGEAFIVKSANDDDFFGPENKFLPVSGQLHLEAMISSFPKVYTFNAAFRAEKSLSRQHLAEFRMLEAEIGFVDNVDTLCNEVDDFMKYIIKESNILTPEKTLLNFFNDEKTSEFQNSLIDGCFSNKPFPRLTYDEAVKMLESTGQIVTNGFNKAQELQLVSMCNSPLFITNFPSEQKPFYMKRSEDGKHALCFDFLAPFVGELVGGSVREDDVHKMQQRMNSPALQWYYDLRSKGTPQSGGFGIGFERLIQTLFGVCNIKDTTPFPRWYKHCDC